MQEYMFQPRFRTKLHVWEVEPPQTAEFRRNYSCIVRVIDISVSVSAESSSVSVATIAAVAAHDLSIRPSVCPLCLSMFVCPSRPVCLVCRICPIARE